MRERALRRRFSSPNRSHSARPRTIHAQTPTNALRDTTGRRNEPSSPPGNADRLAIGEHGGPGGTLVLQRGDHVPSDGRPSSSRRPSWTPRMSPVAGHAHTTNQVAGAQSRRVGRGDEGGETPRGTGCSSPMTNTDSSTRQARSSGPAGVGLSSAWRSPATWTERPPMRGIAPGTTSCSPSPPPGSATAPPGHVHGPRCRASPRSLRSEAIGVQADAGHGTDDERARAGPEPAGTGQETMAPSSISRKTRQASTTRTGAMTRDAAGTDPAPGTKDYEWSPTTVDAAQAPRPASGGPPTATRTAL